MKTIIVCKSDSGSKETEPVKIAICEYLPPYKTMEEWDKFAASQAIMLEMALYDSLPGGVYDRLLGEMLKHKATHFRVAHLSQEDKAGA